jgi:site-specific DNA recombinase
MKVVLYARFSPRPNAAECESCDVQLRDLREWCARNEHTVMGEFRDDAMSGADDSRPGLKDAIEALKRGWALATRTLDRLARDVWMCDVYRKEIASQGAYLISMDGICVADETAEQEFIRTVFSGHAQYVRRKIRETTSRKMRRHQADGRRMSDRVPYGFEEDPDSEPNAEGRPSRIRESREEQSILEAIARMRSQGWGARTIARVLNEEGRLCRGKAWTPQFALKVAKRKEMARAV